jgi:hypothetical protein
MVVLAGLCALVLMSTASPASANAPTKTRAAFAFDVDFAGACPFDVLAHAWGDTQLIMFVDADGNPVRGISTGQFFVTLTNVDSGTSRTFAIPGPSFFDATGTLVHGTGTWLTFTADGEFVLAAGSMNLAPDSTLLGISGRTFDVCELLG